MNTLLTIGAALVAIVAALALIVCGILVVVVRRLIFRAPVHRVALTEELPNALPEALETPFAELEAQGFELLGHAAIREGAGVSRNHIDWRITAVLLEPSTGTVAFLAPSDELGFLITLRTHFTANPTVLTAWSASTTLLTESPGVEIQDAPLRSASATWEAHRATIAGRPAPHLNPTLEQCLIWEQEQDVAYLECMKRDGLLSPDPQDPDQHRATWRTSARLAWRGMGLLLRRAKAEGPASLKPEQDTVLNANLEITRLPKDPTLDEEVAAYLESAKKKRKPRRRTVAFAIFAISAALFALSFSSFVEPEKLALLVGVVLFHELGHLAAMRAFGYQDTSIFFIPFFGAAATGRKLDPKPMEELVVLLAGPVPGIVVAGVLFFGTPEFAALPPVAELIQWLVLLNWFNLLPFVPLDGGRVVQILLTARRPWLDVLFRAFAAAVALLAGYAGDIWVLKILGVIVALSIRPGYRAAVLRAHLRHAPDEVLANEESRLRLLFTAMREKGMGKLPVATRFGLATELTRLSALRSPSWMGIFLGLSAYGLSLASLPLALMAMAVGSFFTGLAAEQPPRVRYGATGPPMLSHSCAETIESNAPLAHSVATGVSSWRWVLRAPDASAARDAAEHEPSARALLGEFAEGAVITGRSHWDRLVFLSLTMESEDGREELMERSWEGTGVEGRWLEFPGSDMSVPVTLACAAASESEAGAIAEPLVAYLEAPHDLFLRPPWLAGPALSDSERTAQERALATYRAITTERGALPAPALGVGALWQLWIQSDDVEHEERGYERDLEKRHRRLMGQLEEAITLARSHTELDDETVELLRAYWRQMMDPTRPKAARALGARLGSLRFTSDDSGPSYPDPEELRLTISGTAEVEGTRVWLPWISARSTPHGLPALAEHLCHQGCETIELRMEEQALWD